MKLRVGEKFKFKAGIEVLVFCLGEEYMEGTIKFILDHQLDFNAIPNIFDWQLDLNAIPKVLTFLKHQDDVIVFKTNSYVFFAKILNQFKDIGEIIEKI